MSDAPAIDFSNHPCFNRDAHQKYGRVHLPVAPRCNIQCNFCNRKYDCVNESRPGVTSALLTPRQALAYLADVVARRPEIKVVGIAGPGDPFANAEETLETLRLVRRQFPDLMLCVATNGLNVGPYVNELAQLKVSHVTVTMTAIDPKIGAKIYAWVRDGKRPLRGEAGAGLLITRQLDAIAELKARGLVVKVNSILVPGINENHIPEIARLVANLGVDIMNVMPLAHVDDAAFADITPPDALMTARTRIASGLHLPQMSHCARCRADAAGLINEPMTSDKIKTLEYYSTLPANTGEDLSQRPCVAVATLEGVLVNQHLGEADQILIFQENPSQAGAFSLKEIRRAPAKGGGEERWTELANTLSDCRAFLVLAAGQSPVRALGNAGVRVIEMEGLIEEGLRAIYSNQPIPAAMKRQFDGCSKGSGCRGSGTGCG